MGRWLLAATTSAVIGAAMVIALWQGVSSDSPFGTAAGTDARGLVRDVWESAGPIGHTHRDMIRTLARRSAKMGPTASLCFAPGTPPEVVDAFSKAMFGGLNSRYQLGGRWSSTVTDGGGLALGDPTTLTYSFVPDGTTVPNGVGEGSGPSDLFAVMNTRFASTEEWQARYHEVFARWSELTGITYVFEPNDDGATLVSSDGVLGVRGDVRLSGKFIDGGLGILAYNYFPFSGGDMVIDTGDVSFYAVTSEEHLNLRNVVAHEHGHGMGIAHVCPANQTKLMEPFLSTAFDGPQHDDRRAGQRMYGDRFEHNDSIATAADLGVQESGVLTVADVSVDDNGDTDYYRFTVPGFSRVSLTVSPVGLSYLAGPQTSSCGSGNTTDSSVTHDLSLEMRDTDGVTVLGFANDNPAGASETIADVFLPVVAGGTFFIRVIPGGTNDVQLYRLDISVTDLDCNNNGFLDEDDVASGTSLDCNANNIPDECELDCDENGTPDDCDIAAGDLTDGNGNGFADECEVLFVDDDAVGIGSGKNWTDAMTDLGTAMTFAAVPENGITEVWVAAGTYRPDQGTGNRLARFELVNGIGLYGGFAGDETERDSRNPLANRTVLSGDLNGDDQSGGNNGENSYHVVEAFETDATSVFDGFVVTGGNANGEAGLSNGGGLFIRAGEGPNVRNCTFIGNAANNIGGGLFTNNAAPFISGCLFLSNSSGNRGGGLSNGKTGTATVVNCQFSGNTANFGAGMNNNGRPLVINCAFSRNSATTSGGGIYNLSNSSILTLSNNILWNNDVGGVASEVEQIHIFQGTAAVDHCSVQGLSGALGGTGNIGADPGFVDDDGDDNVVGTEDDNLRLSASSPCIDAGDNGVVPAGVMADFDGAGRFSDDPDTPDTGDGIAPIVDMGPFEFGVAGCPKLCGDLNGDLAVNLSDFAAFALCFGSAPSGSESCLCSDLDANGAINLVDFATFALLFNSAPNGSIPNCGP